MAFFLEFIMAKQKTDIWMPLYIGDYLADTSRLTTEQHGAYLLLLMDYWRNGKLPNDDAILAQITKLSPDAWSNAQAMLKQFFSIEGKHLVHKRVEEELIEAEKNKETRKARAVAAANARWADKDNATSNATSIPQAMLEQCPSPSPSPLPSSTTKPTPLVLAEKKSAPPKKEVDHAMQEACRQTWKAYSIAFFDRYGTEPVRNAKVNGQVVNFVKRLGFEESPHVASHFLANSNSYYIQRGHTFDALLSDAEKLRTEWATGKTMTRTRAMQIDGTEANRNAVGEAIAMLKGENYAE